MCSAAMRCPFPRDRIGSRFPAAGVIGGFLGARVASRFTGRAVDCLDR